jgi:hypothetical protein
VVAVELMGAKGKITKRIPKRLEGCGGSDTRTF